MSTMKLDRAKVARATVRFPARAGQGVIVPGGLIVTAAHVITWDGTGAMAQGLRYMEEVEAGGQKIWAQVYAAEPVSDIAVLGAPDDQSPETEAFETCLASVAPVPISTADFPLRMPIKVLIRTHKGEWISGQASQWGVNASTLSIKTERGIEGGTSGGPVVTMQGLLLGVISIAGGAVGEPAREAHIPRLHLTAPSWLVRLMRDPQWEIRAIRRAGRADKERR